MRTVVAALIAVLLCSSAASAAPPAKPARKEAARPADPKADSGPDIVELVPPAPTAANPEPPPAVSSVRTVTAYTPGADAEATRHAGGAQTEAPTKYGLMLHAGALHSSESFTPAAMLGHIGAAASYAFKPELAAFLGVDLRLSQQTYITGPNPEGGAARADVNEQRWDVEAGAAYDVGKLLVASGRLMLSPGAALHFMNLANGVFPARLFGVDLMGRGYFALSSALGMYGQLGWTYNLLKNETLSATGAPLWNLALGAGFTLPLDGSFALELGYEGDVLALASDFRVAHGAALGFRARF